MKKLDHYYHIQKVTQNDQRHKCKMRNYKTLSRKHREKLNIGFGIDSFGYDTKGSGNNIKNRQIELPVKNMKKIYASKET